MIIEIATERSVLVELSADDLRKMNLTYEIIGADDEKTAAAWKKILQEIRLRTGRKYFSREVEIDVLPSRSGGCLMIVSAAKLCETEQIETLLFRFVDADAMLDFFSAMRKREEHSTLELLQRGKDYYAILKMGNKAASHLLPEFGKAFRLSDVQMASMLEQSVRLKVFGSS